MNSVIIISRLQKMLRACRLALPAVILMFTEASAVPMIPLGPVDVSGTIMGLRWIPAKRIEGSPWTSGSGRDDRMIPAHFLAALRPYAGPDAELARAFNSRVDSGDLNPADLDQAPDTLVVWIFGVRPGRLKVGMNIMLPAYTLFGDEGGIGVRHDLPVIVARKRHR